MARVFLMGDSDRSAKWCFRGLNPLLESKHTARPAPYHVRYHPSLLHYAIAGVSMDAANAEVLTAMEVRNA